MPNVLLPRLSSRHSGFNCLESVQVSTECEFRHHCSISSIRQRIGRTISRSISRSISSNSVDDDTLFSNHHTSATILIVPTFSHQLHRPWCVVSICQQHLAFQPTTNLFISSRGRLDSLSLVNQRCLHQPSNSSTSLYKSFTLSFPLASTRSIKLGQPPHPLHCRLYTHDLASDCSTLACQRRCPFAHHGFYCPCCCHASSQSQNAIHLLLFSIRNN